MSELPRYFVPGPTWVRPEVLAAMSQPMIGHRTAEFKSLFSRIASDLQQLFRTSGQTFVAAASGTGLLEGAILNSVPRRVLVTTCGAFSERWFDIAQRTGVEADPLHAEWGEAIDPDRLATHLRGRHHQHYDAVTITHSETSTGVLNDVAALAEVIRDVSPDTLILVDAVSSLGSAPVLVDDWGIDVCVASTQKGLALPPGITVFSVSPRALERASRKQFRGTYFDFVKFAESAADSSVPFTPSVPHMYGLAFQLDAILRDETLERRWERHREMRALTRTMTAAFAEIPYELSISSPSVTALRPKMKEARQIVSEMKARGYTLGGGYGEWRESTFRIGHMGDIPLEAARQMLRELEEVATV